VLDINAINAIIDGVSSITIRGLDLRVKAQLRLRAAKHNRSMEEEARTILRTALAEEPSPPQNLADVIRKRFAPLGGVELELPRREPIRKPPKPGR
jgi:plasmid stability protein